MNKRPFTPRPVRGAHTHRAFPSFFMVMRGVVLAAGMVALSAASLAQGAPRTWVGTWAAAPQPAFPGTVDRYQDVTLRLIVHTSLGGERVRIRLSNTHGLVPLTIAAAHVARRAGGGSIDASSDRALSFGGRADVVVAPGETVVSDPVDLDVPALSDLAVSLYAAGRIAASTVHALAQQTSYVSAGRGNVTGAEHLPNARTIDNWPFLTGVDVEVRGAAAAVVVLGDSLVDGDGTDPDTNTRWTDALAARLHKAGAEHANISVLNEGLIGNRLLYDSASRHAPGVPDFGHALGEAGVARFERDVLCQSGVRAVIIHLGTNDIGFGGGVAPVGESATADSLIAGYRVLIARGHKAGLRVIGTTLTPVEGVTVLPAYDTPAKEAMRRVVNDWIRGSGEFDAVIDLDASLRDPLRQTRLLARLASGDHLHPNAAGYAAAAGEVPLDMFDGLVSGQQLRTPGNADGRGELQRIGSCSGM
ncbi:SGNH/GDSL hydrolase family protein [Piscinibacter terrae]|uniref:SGNH/GDSL hydrolase family protein n=1 Tax=Piscinibacter terrae TaxID=2496871 RepID=A0A3N7HUM6_9BURK|nr:SGNH/GDSL hydrolase family protein [Albitalea terrae]RQP26020.1 SGNH/GDSL hydrolase family protein [Albitalea terrae]